MNETLLSVNGLRIVFASKKRRSIAVDDLSFSLNKGETLGIVGESGSGKTLSALSIIDLLPNNGMLEAGEIKFQGQDLSELSSKKIRKIRGNEISMIFQDPIMSLDQVFTVGNQIVESILTHKKVDKTSAKKTALELLKNLEIANPERVYNSYPFELSGGMCQRVMIAIALCCQPKLIIADEPTTALDVTVQAEIMDLLKNTQKNLNMGIILITHDLGVVSDMADKIVVMYAGKSMEQASNTIIFNKPYHPYTLGLIKSIPRLDTKIERLYSIKGTVPEIKDIIKGCRFSTRCPFTIDKCFKEEPIMDEIESNHFVRCHRANEIKAGGLKIEG